MCCMYLSTYNITVQLSTNTLGGGGGVLVQILQSNSSERSGDTDLGQAVD